MSTRISKEILKYALICCSNIENPFIFDDIENNRQMYIGVVIGKRPKANKGLTFAGINVYIPLFNCLSEVTFSLPNDRVVQLTKGAHKEPIYYVQAGNQSAVIYVVSKDVAKKDFENIFLVHLYTTLVKNVVFNYDFLSNHNRLAIVYNSDVYNFIGNHIVYHPIKNQIIDTNTRIKTPTVKKLIPLQYSNNIYKVEFYNTPASDYIILYNNSCSLNQTKDMLLRHNGHYCMLCGNYHDDVQWHHIIPRSFGGQNEYYNGCLLCPECHKLLHDMQFKNPIIFLNLTFEIIRNKAMCRLIYSKLKNNVNKLTF